MTQRTTKRMLDNMLQSLAILTRLDLAYQHFNGNQYQLYEGSNRRVDRTIGRVSIGAGNFYDVLKAAVDIHYSLRAKRELVA